MATLAETYGLRISDGEGGFRNHPGIRWTWWADNGKLMTAKGTYDADGAELTPPTFAAGVVAILRITSQFFTEDVDGVKTYDALTPDEADPDKAEQWARSRVARFVKNNGTPGTAGGISYWELDGVRLYKPADVQAFLVSNDVPGHSWQGGNSF